MAFCARRAPVEDKIAKTSAHTLTLLETGDEIHNDFETAKKFQDYGQAKFVDGKFAGMTHGLGCSNHVCHGAMMDKFNAPQMSNNIDMDKGLVWDEARGFITQFYAEWPKSPYGRGKSQAGMGTVESRLDQVKKEIAAKGTYTMTFNELEFASHLAWRNESRCINRKPCDTIRLLDKRDQEMPSQLFQSMIEHCDAVWNGGGLVVKISVFKPKTPGQRGCEFVTPQWWRFAAYKVEGGEVIGDPANLELTELSIRSGWKAPKPHERTQWDLLPISIQDKTGKIELFELPDRFKTEPWIILLTHPDPRVSEAIEILGLRWCTVPVLLTFTLWAGGIAYQCSPFSGWFMETEIGRDLADVQRYNILPRLIDEMDLPDNSYALSIDTAWLELNKSVLYSFQQHRISIADHQSTSSSFCAWFDEEHKRCGMPVPGDWVWVVPPLGGSSCSIFHQEMLNFRLTPLYCFNENRIAQGLEAAAKQLQSAPTGLHQMSTEAAVAARHTEQKRSIPHIQVLFGSQTGTVERFASDFVRKTTKKNEAHMRCVSLNNFLFDDEVVADIIRDLSSPHLPPPLEESVDEDPDSLNDRLAAVNLLYTKLLEMAVADTYVLVMIATCGQGQFPNNSLHFAQACADLNHLASKHTNIDAKVKDLQSKKPKYAVCGFGSTSYLKFNQAAKALHEELQKLLGAPIQQLGACDAMDGQAAAWAKWQKAFMAKIAEPPTEQLKHGTKPVPGIVLTWCGPDSSGAVDGQGKKASMGSDDGDRRKRVGSKANKNNSRYASKLSMASRASAGGTRRHDSMSGSTGHIKPQTEMDTQHDVEASVVQVRDVAPGSKFTKMQEVTFAVPGSFKYNPGDSIEICPGMPLDLATHVLDSLGLGSKTGERFFCKPLNEDEHHQSHEVRFSTDIKLLDAFRYELDFSGPPPQGMLVYLAWATKSQKLHELADDEDRYAEWVEQEKPFLLDLIKENAISCQEGAKNFVPLEAFLEELPKPRRRAYSISSDCAFLGKQPIAEQQKSKGKPKVLLQVTVSLHEFGPGNKRKGLCSSFLHAVKSGDTASIRVRSLEHLNLEGAKQIFLIGTGSGIAPLRAHWQKVFDAASSAKVLLYQGCQTKADQAYADETAEYVKQGKMEVFAAFSKESPKKYVQDLLKERTDLWKLLQDPGTRVFVSGATRVALAAREAFLEAGTKSGLSRAQAHDAIIKASDERRYVEDVFGGPSGKGA